MTHAGAIVRLGGKEEFVQLFYDRERRLWGSAVIKNRRVLRGTGKTQRECIDALKRKVRGT